MTNVLEILQTTQNVRFNGGLSSPMFCFGTSDAKPITFRDALCDSIRQNTKIPKPVIEAFATFESLSALEQQYLTDVVNKTMTQTPESSYKQVMRSFTDLVNMYYTDSDPVNETDVSATSLTISAHD